MTAAAATVLGTITGVREKDGHLAVVIELNAAGRALAADTEAAEQQILTAIADGREAKHAARRARAASAVRASIER